LSDRVYRLLALCARAECDAAHYHQLGQAAAQLTDWAGVAAQAEAHGMAPLLYIHLKGAGATLPPVIKRELQGLYLRHRHANQVRTRVLCDILTAYQATGIPALVLKGAALAHLVYPEPGLRSMSDMDILVPASEVWRAQQALAGLGFDVPLPTGPASSHRHLAAATLHTEGLAISVEIHHRLFSDYFDNARAYLASRMLPVARPGTQVKIAETLADLTVPPRSFALGDLTAYTLGYEDMLGHLCRHLTSHVNVWDFGRLIWVADIVSFSERFVMEIDWERMRRRHPDVLDTLSLLHFMTPLSDTLLSQAGIQIGRAPQGVGMEYQGWPRIRSERGCRQALRDTLFPSEWWLRLRYQLGSRRPLFWYRWVRHPLHILGHVVRVWLERLGWPKFPELGGGGC